MIDSPIEKLRDTSKAISKYRLRLGDQEYAYGMGCAWLGRNGEECRDTELELLMAAYDNGFRYFDTAAQYGESEVRVGQFLKCIDRDSVFLASKLSLRPGTPELLRPALEKGLARLGTSYVDLIQIHDTETDVGLFDAESLPRALQAVKQLKREGLIRHFGLATRHLDLLARGMTTGLFDSVLTYGDFTPLDPVASILFPDSRRNGVAVINGSPLGFGLLSAPNPAVLTVHSSMAERQKTAILFNAHCKAFGIGMLAATFQFPLRSAEVDLTLTGIASLADLNSTLEALRLTIPEGFWDAWDTLRANSALPDT